jgi:hypothetical protein
VTQLKAPKRCRNSGYDTLFFGLGKKGTKNFDTKKEKIRGDRIPLPNPLCRFNMPYWVSIDNHKIRHSPNTSHHSTHLFFSKPQSNHSRFQKGPLHMIIGLAHVEFDAHKSLLTPHPSLYCVHSLVCSKEITSLYVKIVPRM